VLESHQSSGWPDSSAYLTPAPQLPSSHGRAPSSRLPPLSFPAAPAWTLLPSPFTCSFSCRDSFFFSPLLFIFFETSHPRVAASEVIKILFLAFGFFPGNRSLQHLNYRVSENWLKDFNASFPGPLRSRLLSPVKRSFWIPIACCRRLSPLRPRPDGSSASGSPLASPRAPPRHPGRVGSAGGCRQPPQVLGSKLGFLI